MKLRREFLTAEMIEPGHRQAGPHADRGAL
jgi:hypothetical protein